MPRHWPGLNSSSPEAKSPGVFHGSATTFHNVIICNDESSYPNTRQVIRETERRQHSLWACLLEKFLRNTTILPSSASAYLLTYNQTPNSLLWKDWQNQMITIFTHTDITGVISPTEWVDVLELVHLMPRNIYWRNSNFEVRWATFESWFCTFVLPGLGISFRSCLYVTGPH